MTLANQLTVLRLLLAPAVVVAILYGRFAWAIAALLIAGLTDAIDGVIARRRNENSQLGALLDPLADKVLIVSAVLALAAVEGLTVRIPAWIATMVVARDATILIVVTAYSLAVGRREFPPSRLGKWTTVTHVVGILWILLANQLQLVNFVTPFLLGAMVTLTVVTSVQYLWRARLL